MYVDSPLVFDDSLFNNNAPLTLGAGDSYTGLLFNFELPLVPTTPVGVYTGYFQILGGPDNSSELNPMEAPADFNIYVTPEPSSFMLLGTGLMALTTLAGRKLPAWKPARSKL